MDCHDQSTGASCWGGPKTITDGSGHNFATSNLPGLYLDQASGHLFVYAVRTSDDSAGVVCIDTTQPASASGAQLFCGYTRLTSANQAPFVSYAGVSNPAQFGSNWYAFNEVAGTGTGDENELLCFNLISDAACAAQPFALDFGGGPLATFTNPHPIAAIGNEVIVPVVGTSGDELACFNGATNTSCSDSWPVSITDAEGAPFPLLNSSGSEIGICLPTAGDPCFSFTGASCGDAGGNDRGDRFELPRQRAGGRARDPRVRAELGNHTSRLLRLRLPRVVSRLPEDHEQPGGVSTRSASTRSVRTASGSTPTTARPRSRISTH